LTNIHSTAVVDKNAHIGDNVTIGAFSIIEADVVIGDGSEIASHVLIADGARIGRECRIHKGAVVATLPQDLKFGGEKTTFELGDNCVVREFCTLNRGTTAHNRSVVGKNCLLMAYAHVAHDCTVGDNVILANLVQLGGHVEIEDYAIIGGGTSVHQFCHVGAHTMVAGGYRCVQDVPPYIMVAGEPLRFGGLNSVGMKRRGFTPEQMSQLKRVYRLIYRSRLNLTQAIERIKEEVEQTEVVQNVLRFIERSERGLI
jgi:UDP-N-acetylglucosamine acyltransferase